MWTNIRLKEFLTIGHSSVTEDLRRSNREKSLILIQFRETQSIMEERHGGRQLQAVRVYTNSFFYLGGTGSRE